VIFHATLPQINGNTAAQYQSVSSASSSNGTADRFDPQISIDNLSQQIQRLFADSGFEPLRRQLDEIRGLSDDWDGSGAPAPTFQVISTVSEALPLTQFVSSPVSLVPSAEGGVAISFSRYDRVGQVEFANTGEIVALTYSDDSDPITWNVSIRDLRKTLKSIRDFVSG